MLPELVVTTSSRDVLDDVSVDSIQHIKETGQKQYKDFIQERLVNRTKPVTDTLSRNNVSIFQEKSTKSKPKQHETVSLLKNETSLFARLYVSCQKRDGDLNTFFSHENQPYPPSISSYGKLRQGKKSDLLECLEKPIVNQCNERPETDITIIDGAALVHMLVPKNCKTFQGYVEGIFTAYINAEFIHALRIDLIWDQYEENSLKSQTREKRANGSTLRRKVEMSTPIPSKWHDFLKIDTNKTELFRLISETLTSTVTDKELVATIGVTIPNLTLLLTFHLNL